MTISVTVMPVIVLGGVLATGGVVYLMANSRRNNPPKKAAVPSIAEREIAPPASEALGPVA